MIRGGIFAPPLKVRGGRVGLLLFLAPEACPRMHVSGGAGWVKRTTGIYVSIRLRVDRIMIWTPIKEEYDEEG